VRFFYGRLASDFDTVLAILGRLPGVDPAAIELQLMGEVTGIAPLPAPRWRPLVAAAKTARVVATIRREVRRQVDDTMGWWRESVARAATADGAGALRVFEDACARMPRDMAVQCLVAALHPGFVEKLAALARDVTGDEATALALISGVEMEESSLVRELWRVARDDADLSGFVDRYGFYAPDEGELSTRSWREDPAALKPVLDAYRRLDDGDGPPARLGRTRAAYDVAYGRVRAGATPSQRVELVVLARIARQFTPARELGKTLMLLCLDAGRAGARRLGEVMAGDGILGDPDDVFYVQRSELPAALRGTLDRDTLRRRVEERRALRRAYAEVHLPVAFHGAELRDIVEAQRMASAPEVATVLEGLGVSEGVCRARARVVVDPSAVDIEPGEVLVCPTTDPGWAPLLSLCGGVVLDMGSMLSHGAIVARELGVPCVANVVDGTRTIPDGAIVEVDGTAGRVTVL
jgi:pyruvate,water dikinase